MRCFSLNLILNTLPVFFLQHVSQLRYLARVSWRSGVDTTMSHTRLHMTGYLLSNLISAHHTDEDLDETWNDCTWRKFLMTKLAYISLLTGVSIKNVIKQFFTPWIFKQCQGRNCNIEAVFLTYFSPENGLIFQSL